MAIKESIEPYGWSVLIRGNAFRMGGIVWRNMHRLVLFSLCSFVVASLYAAPQIECENPKYDFGTVIGQEKITHEFILWNRGDEPLEIKRVKNCCGVETEVVPVTIPPGSNAVCTAVFTTKNRYGTQDKQILLVTNDKKHLYYDLRMSGKLLKPVEFKPRIIRLGKLLPDSSISETIIATNLLETAVTLESVSTTVMGLETVIIRDQGSRLQDAEVEGGIADWIYTPRQNWTIRLKSTGPFKVGKLNGQIQLKFSSGTMTVPVIGEVKPILQATPAKIQLSSNSAKTAERLVMLRSGDGRDFEIVSARLENAEGSVEIKKLVGGKWQIKLSIQPDSIKPDASVFVTTSVCVQEIISISLWKQ